MKTFKLYAVKKFFVPFEVTAEDYDEAEQKGYEWLEENMEKLGLQSDDTYIYNDGEVA